MYHDMVGKWQSLLIVAYKTKRDQQLGRTESSEKEKSVHREFIIIRDKTECHTIMVV